MSKNHTRRLDEEQKLGSSAYFAMLAYAHERIEFGRATHSTVRQEFTELTHAVFNTPLLEAARVNDEDIQRIMERMNKSPIANNGQSEVRFNPTGVSGAAERGGVKTKEHPGGSSLFGLYATLRIDADDYLRKLNEISEATDALIEKTERLVLLMQEVGRAPAATAPPG